MGILSPCPCASRDNSRPDGSLNWLRNTSIHAIEQGSCSRAGITANNIDMPCKALPDATAFAACCTKNTPLSNTTIPAWCSGAWTLSRTPPLQKFKAYNLPAPQQCYSENNDAYACDRKSDFCFFGNGSELFAGRNESACAQTSSPHGTSGVFAGSWGSKIYLHTDGFVNEVLPLDL